MNSELNIRRAVVDSAKRLVEQGLVERTWGNVSARLDSDTLLITPTGCAYSSLDFADLVKVDSKTLIKESKGEPSSELFLHAKIYNTFPKANVVLHTHQKWASILSLFCGGKKGCITLFKNKEKILDSSLFFAEYAIAGTEQIAQNIVDVIIKNTKEDARDIASSQVLMAKHGVVVFANDFERAFLIVEMLEKTAKNIIQTIINEYSLPFDLDSKTSFFKLEFLSDNIDFENEIIKKNLTFVYENKKLLTKQIYIFDVSPVCVNIISYLYFLSLQKKQVWHSVRNLLGIPSYFDDTSQIAGAFCPFIDQKTFSKMSVEDFASLLDVAKVFIVKDVGIFFYAPSNEEAIYLARLFNKNVFAFILSLYDKNITPLTFENALSLHTSYLKGYSLIKK